MNRIQKYAVIIGADCPILSAKVQRKLFEFGFGWEPNWQKGLQQEPKYTNAMVLSLNSRGDIRVIRYSNDLNLGAGISYINPQDILTDGWVEKNIEGALKRKPYEIVPEGYRLVTDNERKTHSLPKGFAMACSRSLKDSYFKTNHLLQCWSSHSECLSGGDDYVAFIVPDDHVFGTVELTMEQIAEQFGITVDKLRIKD